MTQAHERAAQALGVACPGPAAWGWEGRTIGRPCGTTWLRVAAGPDRPDRDPAGHGIATAEQLLPDDVPRPRLHALTEWTQDGYRYEAELITRITTPVISPDRPDIDHDPKLPEHWWTGLRRALDTIAKTDQAPRTTIRESWIERNFPRYLGISAPATVARVTGHADIQWANLTGDPLTLLDWERWGAVPVGYDAGVLIANSLRVPALAERARAEFADILSTPAGRIGELIALAEMLQAVGRGWYPELAPLLAERAAHLTGVRPPTP
ncbi:hypothetical protein ACFCXR_21990 [Streptomyces noursei]|uniref:hypothetical protein n=1 Tax=Streptomyces TaxID=1883 RepID=UPI0035DD60EF